MADEKFSFSVSMGPAPTSKGGRTRYIAPPFDARAVGNEAVIRIAGHAESHRLPLFHARALGVCDGLRNLAEHQRRISSALGLGPNQQAELETALEELVQRKLLREEKNVFDSLRAADDESHDPVRTLFIRTCNRPAELERLLLELGPVARDAGLESVFVLDDSRDEQTIERNAEIAEQARRDGGVKSIVVDRRRRSDLLRRLADAAGVDRPALEWMIEGDDDDTAPSYGAGLNLALLLGAGRRIAVIDDDAGLAAYARETPGSGLSLRPEFEQATMLLDPREADETSAFQAIGLNPLAAHGEILGQSTAALADRFGLQDGFLLDALTPALLHDLRGECRVRITTNGTLGDSGTGSPAWVFATPPDTLRACWHDPQTYERMALGRRVARCPADIQVAPGVALMTTTLTGIDDRDLLLPTMPKGRGEDLLFGALVEFLYPATPTALLPWMLRHRLDHQPAWSRDELARGWTSGLAAWLVHSVDSIGNTIASTQPERRTAALAAWLDDLAACEPAELVERLRVNLLHHRADRAAAALETLRGLQAPEWMRTDFETLVDANMSMEAPCRQGLEALAASIRRFAGRYAASLSAWCAAWRWCADHSAGTLLEQSD